MMNIELYTTIPESVSSDRHEFIRELKRIVLQSEKYGYKGILVYSDNRLIDPWVVAELILNQTHKLVPMVALQPVYMHPYTVAKKISSLAFIYGRRIALNLVAGGYINDLKALGDTTEHNRRYDRLTEYTEVIQKLLTSREGVSYEGEFYQIKNLKLKPEMPDNLQPLYYLSGSSSSAKEAAKKLNVKIIQYPEPIKTYSDVKMNGDAPIEGIRIGILARHSHEKAWKDAIERFPKTRNGQILHQMAVKTSDSEWHNNLSAQSEKEHVDEPVYWLGPFENYHTFCPYLVGDYDEVAKELSVYLGAGCDTCIIDTPVSAFELQNTLTVFNRAQSNVEYAS